ncbi:MAG: aldo/keto reductase, partial [Planctomycetota bacterium]
QTDSQGGVIAAAADLNLEVHVFWTLMKGLLAGKIGRDHRFQEGDSRPGYDIFRGEKRDQAHRLLDRLHQIANESPYTVPQLSIGWALAREHVCTAVVGARRPDQVDDVIGQMALDSATLERIDVARKDVGLF